MRHVGCITLVILYLSPPLWSMNAALDRFFNHLGTEINTSQPGAFHDQSAGHYTAGGMMVRQKNRAYQPITISPPSFSAGCSGIDAYFGGASFMNGQQLGQLLRQMGTQAATYALQLGLKTMAPQIEGLLSQLRKLALDANALMLGDCRQMQQMFAAALPKGTAFQEHACIDVRKQGGGEDWFGAKQQCHTSDHIASAAHEAQRKNPDLLVGPYNLLWHILKKLGLSPEERLLWHTIAGTIVHRREGDRFVHVPYIGHAANDTTWNVLLRGGTLDLLACDEEIRCLYPTRRSITIPKGLKDRIGERIHTIQEKYLHNTTLTSEDITFLNDVSSVPLWKYIQVLSASGSFTRFETILDHIALQLLLTQLDHILSDVDTHLHTLSGHQQETSQIDLFAQRLKTLKTHLRLRQGPLSQNAVFQLNQMITAEENRIRIVHHF